MLKVLPMVGGKLDSKQVLVALPNGEQQLIPTEWTDQVKPPPSSPGALFLLDHLVILRRRVDGLLKKEVNQAILTVNESELDRSGGSDVDRRSQNPMGTDESRTASQDHRHPGRNARPPMETGNGGAT